jgi:hypothetical protein
MGINKRLAHKARKLAALPPPRRVYDAGHRQSHRLATRCGVTGSAEATNMTTDVLAIIFLSTIAAFLAITFWPTGNQD